ncbi:MAG TPA: MarR family transcriptional regulator [Aurantimonas sp.]|uniref:HTH marR-type domain-containing protein n=1 Tax=Aurantimonas marianensis TaxID=2920428 RepID=A0A9X2HCH8_9HYPH|nr:MarR family transcriptional regulator [Aurantimonas marianensis]MCP3055967.1 hypothetical protein [Aurantimonas marianensis]
MNIAVDQDLVRPCPEDLCRARFIDRMGDHLEAEGMPRIAGRLFGLMILEPGVVSFSDLAARLCVSRASISTNARLLESKGLIVKVQVEGERQDFFRLADRPYVNMIRGVAHRMEETQASIVAAETDLPPDAIAERQRLEQAREFFETAVASLNDLAAKLCRLDEEGRGKQ